MNRFVLMFVVAGLVAAGCGPNTSRMTPRDGARGTGASASAPADWPAVEARSSVQATGGRDAALIVAIEDYTFLPDVPGAVANGEAWRTFLEDNMGVPRVYTLYDQKASREEMKRFAQRAAADVQPGGKLWFVFVGHGAPSPRGEGLLIGMDAQQTVDSLGARSASQSEIVNALRSGEASDVVMVVDACFSGRDGGGQLLAKGSQPVVPVQAANVPTNVVMISAAQSNEFAGSLPDEDRPAFSYLLLGALRGWADDGDGSVTTGEAVRWTQTQLGHVTGRTQTPTIAGSENLRLTSNATEADPGIGMLMRGVRGSVAEVEPPKIKGHDTGKGVAVPIPDGWFVHSSVPASYHEDGPTEVVRLEKNAQTGEFFSLYYMKHGGNHFTANIKRLSESLEERGATMDRQLAVRIGGERDGLRQTFRYTRPDGTKLFTMYEYYLVGDDMWFWMASHLDRNDTESMRTLDFIGEHTEFR